MAEDVAGSQVTKELDRAQEQSKLCAFLRVATIEYAPQGVLLTFPVTQVQDLPTLETVLGFLERKKLRALNKLAVRDMLRNGQAQQVKIAPPQRTYVVQEELRAEVAWDRKSATAQLLPPEPGAAQLTLQDMVKVLTTQYNVVSGIAMDTLAYFEQEHPYGIAMLVAAGNDISVGEQGRIDWKFNLTHPVSTDLFKIAAENRDNVRRYLAWVGAGEVLGRVLWPTAGAQAEAFALPKLVGVRPPNSAGNLVSDVEGVATLIAGKLSVLAAQVFSQRVEQSLESQGHVFVAADVAAGVDITAAGSIVITGSAQGATLKAGGHVLVLGQAQGEDFGSIEAGGSVYVHSAAYATILCKGDLFSSQLMHCNVRCTGRVEVVCGRGQIVGGNTYCGGSVTVGTLGTPGSVRGVVRIDPEGIGGIDPRALETALETLDQELRRESHIVKTMPQQINAQRRAKLNDRAFRRIVQLKKEIAEKTELLSAQKVRASGIAGEEPMLVVQRVMYTNISVTIRAAELTVRDESGPVRFKQVKSYIVTDAL